MEKVRENISKDIIRFSNLHRWSKRLPFEGVEFLIYPYKGQQPKNHHEYCVDDTEGIHWWIEYADFIDEIPIHDKAKEIIMKNSFKLNCFFKGPNIEDGHIKDWSVMKIRNPQMMEILQKKYPMEKDPDILSTLENAIQMKEAIKAAHEIYSLFSKHYPELLSSKKSKNLKLKHDISNLSRGEIPPPLPPLFNRNKVNFWDESYFSVSEK